MAAKQGGGAPESNPRLRKAIDDAKAVNMPADNIKRAIQRGTGELPGVSYEEVTYEGYGPGGTAVLIEALTDNKNRTLPEIRTIFSKHGGNLGESGSVRFLFQKRGYIAIEKDKASEDAVMEAAIEAGADDVETTDQYHEIQTAPESFEDVKKQLEGKGLAARGGGDLDDPDDRGRARRPQGGPDGQAHGGDRGPRRRAERLGELRLRRGTRREVR